MPDETDPNGTELVPVYPPRPPLVPAGPANHIWQQVVADYYNELDEHGIEPSPIDRDLRRIQTPQDLLPLVEALKEATTAPDGALRHSMAQPKTLLSSLNDYAAVTSCIMGINIGVVAVLWGSAKLIMKVSGRSFLLYIIYVRS